LHAASFGGVFFVAVPAGIYWQGKKNNFKTDYRAVTSLRVSCLFALFMDKRHCQVMHDAGDEYLQH